jgi:hypothetical protein
VTDRGERWSGGQLSVGQRGHMSTWDRTGGHEKWFELPHFWARCVSLADT